MKQRFDFWFFAISFILCIVGITNIYSATVSDNAGHVRDLWKNQIVWVFIGFIAFINRLIEVIHAFVHRIKIAAKEWFAVLGNAPNAGRAADRCHRGSKQNQ